MRRTKVTQIYKKTGNLRAVQLLLGHTKIDSTVRYLGVELEDALAIAEAIEIQRLRVALTGGPKRTIIEVHACCCCTSYRIQELRGRCDSMIWSILAVCRYCRL